MSGIRIGTRGSDLALWQARWVADALRRLDASLAIELVVITTHGDAVTDQPLDADGWPTGAFVTAIERALIAGEVDVAVHSYKDQPSAEPEALVTAAVPPRAAVQDVLLSREPVELEALPSAWRVGTSSPRRREQVRRLGSGCTIAPLRGNVPTRVAKLERGEYDAIVVAAAGLDRLGIVHPHRLDLPVERFVPAPAQGALAVQARRESPARAVVARLDDEPSRRLVTAERALLAAVDATCRTPIGALATERDGTIELRGQLFSDDGRRCVSDVAIGHDPAELGRSLGLALRRALEGAEPCTCG